MTAFGGGFTRLAAPPISGERMKHGRTHWGMTA
jgi:hypothetical protein